LIRGLFTRVRGRGVLRCSLRKVRRSPKWGMRLVAMLARVGASVDTAGLITPPSLKEEKMAKTNHWGPLVAAAGTLVAVGLVLLIMVVVEARPAEATFPGKPGKIAYQGTDGSDAEIYTINSGGGGKVQLTDNSTGDYEPSYSPSAKKIVYSGFDGPNGDLEIYTINAGGGGKVQLTDNSTNDAEPSYSPDGKKIVYTGRDAPNGDSEIYTINSGGGGKLNVTDNSTDDGAPSYSPSGKKIVYSGFDGPKGDYEIYTINSGGGGKVQLTDNSTSDYYSSYSPDGKKIAYQGYDAPKGDYEIYTINAGGGGKFNVTDNSTDDSGGLSYSPDGKKIAYSGDEGQDYEIYTINPGGEEIPGYQKCGQRRSCLLARRPEDSLYDL
jgi:Tol biopolymer transport system component